jgi:hypothetical protein
MVSLSATAHKFLNTFFNTIKYQIATRAITGIVNGISEAFNFTVSLDKSLNDIRIVTGKSAQSMARFAGEAQKAAENLKTTVKTYADASLIYF